ncbi:MAG: HD domain-containing protein [Prevotella sp.]|jgi:hypothetical protein|nr:HD domain-containing protein [Prevotella sp.]
MLSRLKLTNLTIDDISLNSVINEVYERAKSVLETNLFPHYTKHDIGHSERILKRIDKLIDENAKLTNDEKFILICAVLLHDIGMQAPKRVTQLTLPFGKESNEILKQIRDNHHIISYELIKDSVSLNQSDTYYLGLKNKVDYVDYIALVAKNHRKLDYNTIPIEKYIDDDSKIRLQLLCSLMLLGDCLDITRKRVDIEKLNLVGIDTESQFHCYKHYYVSAIHIDNQTITISLKFPEKYEHTGLINIIKQYIEDEIVRHLDLVGDTLHSNNVKINSKIKIDIDYGTDVKEMPSDVTQYVMKLPLQNETYTGGLGEIEFYWGGNRETANEKIIEYLKTSDLSEIFIAAIGFGTISSVLENEEVKTIIQDRILTNSIKMTFVLPGSLRDLLNFRQEINEKRLNESYLKGQLLLTDFRKKLAESCFPTETEEERSKKIAKHIEIKQYVGSIPRHFILYGSDETIFFGAYLGHTTGKKSYMMKLKSKEDVNEDSQMNKGLFTLFTKEIEYIKEHSKITQL